MFINYGVNDNIALFKFGAQPVLYRVWTNCDKELGQTGGINAEYRIHNQRIRRSGIA